MAGNLRLYSSMLRNGLLVLVLFTLANIARAQTFESPQRASAGITLAIEIKDAKDLEHVQKNLQKFYGVQRVRVNGNVEISKVAAVLELLDDLQDVQLMKFSGQISDDDLLKLEWVDNVTLFLQNGKEDQILMNNNLGQLNSLTLIFEIAPEDYYFIDALGKIKSLTLIAPFVAKEVKAAVSQVCKLKNLKQFGISVDKISDIPVEINCLKNLNSFTIIDNASWMSEKYLDNIPVLRKNIEYMRNNQLVNIDFFYKASEAELFPWDMNHLGILFPGGRFAPIRYANGDSTEISSFADFVKLRDPKPPVFQQYTKENALLGSFPDMAYTFNASNEENRVYYLGRDVAVMVPARCLRGKDSVFRGDYTLRCKWLNTPSKLFAQGQSLEFDSASRRYQLAPTGILDIAASAGNEKLALRDGYFIKIVFLDRPDSTGHFYAWNSGKNKWDNFYDYDYNFDDSKIVPIDFYNFTAGKKTAVETFGADKSDLTWRFETKGYFYLLEPNALKASLENYGGYWVAPARDKVPAMGAYTLKRGKSLIGLKKEYVDKKTEAGIVKFQVFDKTFSLFPELKPFENYIFEIKTNLNPRDFSAQFIRGQVYSDIRIEPVGNGFVMDLRTDEGYWRLDIQTPAEKFRNNPGRAKLAHSEFLRKYNKYKSIRQQKETAFQNWANNYVSTAMGSTRSSLFQPAAKPKGMVVREIKIRSLGMFAWANPIQQPDTFSLIIKFTDEGGIPLDVKRAFVAHTGPFSYQSFGAADNYNVLINPSHLQYIACIDSKNRVFVLNVTDYRAKAIKNNSLVFLAVNQLPPSVKSLKDLEKLLGFKNK